jgi:hypothetical protein
MFTCRRTITGLLLLVTVLAFREAAAQSGPGPYYTLPSWDQTIPGSKRFLVLTNFNKEAVLDYETGLVWERTPDPTLMIWVYGYSHCGNRTTGGRMGWRLPSMAELTSLIDPSVPAPGPMLPAGHPFGGSFPTLGPGSFFWTSTPFSEPAFLAWAFSLATGSGATYQKDNSTFSFRAWCVRGPSSPGL